MQKEPVLELLNGADDLIRCKAYDEATLQLMRANTMALVLIAEQIQTLDANLNKVVGVSLDGHTFLKTVNPDDR